MQIDLRADTDYNTDVIERADASRVGRGRVPGNGGFGMSVQDHLTDREARFKTFFVNANRVLTDWGVAADGRRGEVVATLHHSYVAKVSLHVECSGLHIVGDTPQAPSPPDAAPGDFTLEPLLVALARCAAACLHDSRMLFGELRLPFSNGPAKKCLLSFRLRDDEAEHAGAILFKENPPDDGSPPASGRPPRTPK